MGRQRLPRSHAVEEVGRPVPSPPRASAPVPGVHHLLDLQRCAGNRVATAEAARIQAKLLVGPAADPAEHQADEVAREVMRHVNSSSPAQVAEIDDGEPGVQRKVLPAEAPIGLAGGETSPELAASIQSERGRGEALPPSVLQPFERAFGTDLSNVRVHHDAQAAALNRAVSAKAFTTGSDIFFGAGEYRPSSRGGQELLAHEVTHTIQQR